MKIRLNVFNQKKHSSIVPRLLVALFLPKFKDLTIYKPKKENIRKRAPPETDTESPSESNIHQDEEKTREEQEKQVREQAQKNNKERLGKQIKETRSKDCNQKSNRFNSNETYQG